MQDYRVQLDVFQGPLDLLLHLIQRDEIDIHDIPISRITQQYMQYLQTIQKLDINLAGEFLVMAATLMEIKSALLAPRPEGEGTEGLTAAEDPTDPRYELIQQLLAYKRYKDAAGMLGRHREDFEARFARTPGTGSGESDPQAIELDMDDVSLWDLVEAFGRMMDQVGLANAQHEVILDDTPIELHAADLADRLERDGSMTLQQIFQGRTLAEMIGLFLAMLELVRQRRISIRQEERGGPIHVALRDNSNDPPLDQLDSTAPTSRDPRNADDFDWPDEQTRQRYIRRQERRERGEVIQEDADFAADVAELEAKQGTESSDDGSA